MRVGPGDPALEGGRWWGALKKGSGHLICGSPRQQRLDAVRRVGAGQAEGASVKGLGFPVKQPKVMLEVGQGEQIPPGQCEGSRGL